MTIKVFLLGSNGHLGSKIYHVLNGGPFSVITVQHGNIQNFISNFPSIISFQDRAIIINCAAIVGNKNVQKSACNALSKVNSIIPFQLAKLIKNTRSFLVHFSSNSVFDSSPSEVRSYSTPTSSNSLYGNSKILAENYIVSTLNYSQFLILRTPQQYSNQFLNPRNFLSVFQYNCVHHKINRIVRHELFSCASTLEIALFLRDSLFSHRYGIHHCTEQQPLTWSCLAQIYKDIHNVDYIYSDDYYTSPPINSTLFAPQSYSIPSRMIEFIESSLIT